MNPVTLTLATQRLTQLITEDEITRGIREKVGAWSNEAPEYSLRERIGYAVDCPACVSVWAGAAVLGLTYAGAPGRLVVKILAASGAALLADAVRNRITEGT